MQWCYRLEKRSVSHNLIDEASIEMPACAQSIGKSAFLRPRFMMALNGPLAKRLLAQVFLPHHSHTKYRVCAWRSSCDRRFDALNHRRKPCMIKMRNRVPLVDKHTVLICRSRLNTQLRNRVHA
jgi:hypothetical protein